ncbi:MAG: TolC family protein [Opitutaceae bacterium]
MKNLRLLAAMPLLIVGLFAADSLSTPEQFYPQLDGILKKAVAQSPRMISRAIDLDMAENDRVAAQAGLLPSVGGSYSYNLSQDKRGDLPDRSNVTKIYYNFSVTQPIYHWGERRNNARMGDIRKLMAESNYTEAYRLFAQEVRSLYLRLIISKLRADKAAFQNEYSAKQLARSEERLAKKVISEAQMFGFRMEAERSQIGAERARFDLENDKSSFARLTGQPMLADSEIPDVIPAISTQDSAIQGMLSGFLSQKDAPTPEALNYRNSLEIEKLSLANQKTRLKPKFNLVVGVSQDEQSYSLNVAQKYSVNSRYAGISVNWTIFDGFAARSAVRTSLSKLRMMENDYRVLTDRLAQQAQTQAKMAGFYARYASINDRYLDSGEGNVKSKKEEFTRGVIAEEDVSVAQLGLYDAKINAYSSRADYYNQVTEFLGTVVQDPVLSNLSVK